MEQKDNTFHITEIENVSLSTKKAEEHLCLTINELFEEYEGVYIPERYNWGEKAGREVW